MRLETTASHLRSGVIGFGVAIVTILAMTASTPVTMTPASVTVPSGDGASPDAPATTLGPAWAVVGYAPGRLAAVPQPYAYDTVVNNKTVKKVFLTWGAQPDVATVDSVNGTAVSDDSAKSFNNTRQTAWTGLNMIRVADGSLLSTEFIPEWTDGSHNAVYLKVWRSTDQGETWKLTKSRFAPPDGVEFDPAGFDRGMRVWRNPILLPDGTVLQPAYTRFKGDPRQRSILLQTKDAGRTWTLRSTIRMPTAAQGTNEVALSHTTDGRLLAVMRTEGGSTNLLKAFSEDDGLTWTPADEVRGPENIGAGLASPVLALQPNGMLLLSYGRPDNHLLVSSDGTGKVWDDHKLVFANPPSQVGPGRLHGSSANTAVIAVESNRSVYFYDECHTTWACKQYNEKFGIWATYVDAVGPGTGKIDVASKLAANSVQLAGDFAAGDKPFPEQRPEGAFDGSSEPRASTVLASNDMDTAPSMTLTLDRSYSLDRIGLMLGAGQPQDATMQLSMDGTTWSAPVVTATNVRDYAMRYTTFPAQQARYVKVTGPAGKKTPVTELELYASNVDTYENEAPFGIPRGYTDALNATVTDIELGGNQSRRSMRLLDYYTDQLAKITKVAPDRPHQVATFDMATLDFRTGFGFSVKGRSAGALTTRWQFLLQPGAAGANPTLRVYNGTAWTTIGTLNKQFTQSTWLPVSVDATTSQATVTIDGQVFTTTATNQAADALAGVTFGSAGTSSYGMEIFIDDLSIGAPA
jgi:hypothetical protein